MDNVQAEFN